MATVKLKWLHGKTVGLYAIPAILLSGVLVNPMIICCLAIGYICCFVTHKLKIIEITTTCLILTTIVAEVVTLYEIVPLIWLNTGNMVGIMILHGLLGHTVLWYVIEFALPVPHTEIIEVFLFTTYPSICCAVFTWFLGSVSSYDLIPYYLLYVGFAVFQLCAKPRESSLREKDHIVPLLEASIIGCIMIGTGATPLFLYASRTFFFKREQIWRLIFWLEGYFILTQSSFLMTLLPVQAFTSVVGISKNRILILRWISGISTALLVIPVLEGHGYESEMLLTLKGKLLLFILLTAFISQRKKRNLNILISFLLIGLFIYQIKGLPWGFRLFRDDPTYLNRIYVGLGLSLILAVACIWAFFYTSKFVFSMILAGFVIIFHWVEWSLYMVFMNPTFALFVSSGLFVYTLLVLDRNERIHAVIFQASMSIVATKLLLLAGHSIEGVRLHYPLPGLIATLLAAFAISRLLLAYEANSLFANSKRIVFVTSSVILPLIGCGHFILSPILTSIFDIEIVFMHLFGGSCLIYGLLLIPYSFLEEAPLSNRLAGPLGAVFGLVVVFLHAYLPYGWSGLVTLALMSGAAATLFLLHSDENLKTYRLFFCLFMSGLMGALLTFAVTFTSDSLSTVSCLLLLHIFSGVFAMGLIAFLMPVLQQTRWVPRVMYAGSATSFLLSLTTFFTADERVVFGSISFFFIAAALLLKLSEGKRKRDEVVIKLAPESTFAVLGNVCLFLSLCTGLAAFRFDFENPLLTLMSTWTDYILYPDKLARFATVFNTDSVPAHVIGNTTMSFTKREIAVKLLTSIGGFGMSVGLAYLAVKLLADVLDPTVKEKKKAMENAKRLLTRVGVLDNIQLTDYELCIAANLIDTVDLTTSWNDIGGLDDVITEIRQSVILPFKRPDLFSSSVLFQAPKGVLLHGPPGCGKTMIARALARDAGARFINLQASSLFDKWYGESEKRVEAIFGLATKLQPTIIFIDEIDAFLRSRDFQSHESTVMMKTQFMSFWDGLCTDSSARVMILGATNRPGDLDKAIMRRMPIQIKIPMPETEQREHILRRILRTERVTPELVNLVPSLASRSSGMSGSDMREMCREATVNRVRSVMSRRGFNEEDSLTPNDLQLEVDDFEKALLKQLNSRNFATGERPTADSYVLD